MLTAISGSTGFIGQHLVRSLLRDGQRLRLLVRSDRRVEEIPGCPAPEVVRTDLFDLSSLKQALAGCRQLYYLAAYARNWSRDRELYFKVNVAGFRNILEAALATDLERVVLVSSSVVSGPSSSEPVTEDRRRDHIPFFTEYETSKALAEKLLPAYLDRGLEIITARPTRVYGPGLISEANSVTRLIKIYLQYRVCPLLNRGLETGNYVYVEDVVVGLKLLMTRGQSGQAYFLGDENISLAGFYNRLEQVSGRRALRLRIPSSLALAVARMESWKARKFGLYPLITEGWVRTFLQNWPVNCDKARLQLGYRPRGLTEGLRLTCEWLGYRTVSQGHIPSGQTGQP
ncbi:MAG: NAD-dependent epimerase/dehydratase family protein [Candidatus Saccharicenans sp.]|uniref:NAD-dependent epimerase/dehydratase family protein n=1 Tax=Candidatus Saccharicenans sp. TaxID=2819258 RepID=UPI00404AF242